jgi:hypothetical protein
MIGTFQALAAALRPAEHKRTDAWEYMYTTSPVGSADAWTLPGGWRFNGAAIRNDGAGPYRRTEWRREVQP